MRCDSCLLSPSLNRNYAEMCGCNVYATALAICVESSTGRDKKDSPSTARAPPHPWGVLSGWVMRSDTVARPRGLRGLCPVVWRGHVDRETPVNSNGYAFPRPDSA